MPQSRNRSGHAYQKRAAIPAKQRVKGRLIWAILFAVFGVIIAFFSAGENYLVLFFAAILSAILGYVIGKSMEQDVTNK
jgi:multisubunit Na+/H+ antiporter MnhG subunit